jgi:hypothetical protein
MSAEYLLAAIRREFQDHPGIIVTLPQARSRWGLDEHRCAMAFDTLLAEGFLRRMGDGYVWPDAPAPKLRITQRRPPETGWQAISLS